MDDAPDNLILKQLAQLRGAMDDGFAKIERRIDTLDHKVGALAQTLLGVQCDVRRLSDNVETLAAVVDEHTHRLDRIEKRLGLIDA